MARIADADIAYVRDHSDIEAIVSQVVTLKRSGGNLKGLCPFHDEKSGSFNVNLERGIYHCLAGETGVLTKDGVVPIRTLAGTKATILDGKKKWVEAPFYSFGTQRLMAISLSRNGRKKVIYATPEHRWFVRPNGGRDRGRTEVTTAELKVGARLAHVFPHPVLVAATTGVPSPFGIARGFTYGDGTRDHKGSVARFYGHKDQDMRRWFEHCRTWTNEDETITSAYGLPAYFKDKLPSLDEEPSYLFGWLAGYFAADGCVADDGDATLHSAKRSNLEYVQNLCIRLGVGTFDIGTVNRKGITGEFSDMFSLRLMTKTLPENFFLISEHRKRFIDNPKAYERRGWVVESVTKTDREEEVFCAVVDTTNSFVIEGNILTGNCFGCGAGGDCIKFVQETQGSTFVEAVTYLAEKLGHDLSVEETPGAQQNRQNRNRLIEATRAAATYFSEQLGAEEGLPAVQFLTERGFTQENAVEFECGYAPKGWHTTHQHLKGLGFTDDELLGAGLLNKGDKGAYDAFRGRLIFPIKASSGDIIGFGARKLYDDDQGPKYLNTPETSLYRKTNVLYGIDKARRQMRDEQQAVVVEGYTDVMACHISGVTNAVATCGTAFGEAHAKMIKRMMGGPHSKVIYLFDGDEAGQKAAKKSYELDSVFGNMTYAVVLPGGMDPCELRMAQGDEAVRDIVANPKPLFTLVLEDAIGQVNLHEPESQQEAVRRAGPILAAISNITLRDQYSRKVAGLTGTSLDEVRRASRGPGHMSTPAQREAPPAAEDPEPPEDDQDPLGAPAEPADTIDIPPPLRTLAGERATLRLVLQYPDLRDEWRRFVEPSDYQHPTYRMLAENLDRDHPTLDMVRRSMLIEAFTERIHGEDGGHTVMFLDFAEAAVHRRQRHAAQFARAQMSDEDRARFIAQHHHLQERLTVILQARLGVNLDT